MGPLTPQKEAETIVFKKHPPFQVRFINFRECMSPVCLRNNIWEVHEHPRFFKGNKSFSREIGLF